MDANNQIVANVIFVQTKAVKRPASIGNAL